MSDDEDLRLGAELVDAGDAFVFVASDTTVAVEGPPRKVFILPRCSNAADEQKRRIESDVELFMLPHPRTGGDALHAVVPGANNTRVLCQIHLHTLPFSTFFVDSMIEPDGAIRVANPVDLTYLGGWLLLQACNSKTPPTPTDIARWYEHNAEPVQGHPDYPFKFMCVEDLLSQDPRLAPITWGGFLPSLRAALRHVAEFREIDAEDVYFRLNVEKLVGFYRARFEDILHSKTFRKVVYPDRRVEPRVGPEYPSVETGRSVRRAAATANGDADLTTPVRTNSSTVLDVDGEVATPATTAGAGATPAVSTTPAVANAPLAPPEPQHDDFLKLRALNIVLELVPKVLHTMVAKVCQVELDTMEGSARSRATKQAQASTATMLERDYTGRGEDLESTAKKHRAEQNPKSSSVKKLEKAGPPKGTPTLSSMFAKKKKDEGGDASPPAA